MIQATTFVPKIPATFAHWIVFIKAGNIHIVVPEERNFTCLAPGDPAVLPEEYEATLVMCAL